jgi:hypothetical protein
VKFKRKVKAVDGLSEEEFERLCDAEVAKVDAIMAELRAAWMRIGGRGSFMLGGFGENSRRVDLDVKRRTSGIRARLP